MLLKPFDYQVDIDLALLVIQFPRHVRATCQRRWLAKRRMGLGSTLARPSSSGSLAIGSNAEMYAICRSDVRPQHPTIYQQIVAFFLCNDTCQWLSDGKRKTDNRTSKQIPSKSAGFPSGRMFGLSGFCLMACRERSTRSVRSLSVVCVWGPFSRPLGICQIYDSVAWHTPGISFAPRGFKLQHS